jgi:hypothetical protein
MPAATKTAIAPEKTKATGKWARCQGCDRERGIAAGAIMVQHRRWDGWQMVPCEGGGEPPEM